ncbi:MAG: hypothetical protein LBF97_03670 [Elusimicrobiota bacterium]|jgi:hypothetical protein|nr:hypothetical protein [Elusimicrobiota bacterium]
MLKSRSKYNNIDDEYYTSYQTAELFLKDFIPLLKKEKRIICPCDTQESEIFKYLKDNEINVECYDKMEEVDYITDNPVVITNPPFSKIKEFLNLIRYNRYIFISSHFTPHYAYFRPFIFSYWSKSFAINDWLRPKGYPKKTIKIRFITNIKNDFKLFQLPYLEPEENKDYDISCLDYDYDKQKWQLIHTAYGEFSPNFIFKKKENKLFEEVHKILKG